MELLNQSAFNYLNTNNTLLLGVAPNLNMPATFTLSYKNAATAFSNQYADFKSAEETSPATAAKITSNNKCFRTMMSMMKDGQLIFANDLETKKLFVFNSLWDLINPPVSGIKGMVKANGSNEPLAGAKISIQKEGEVSNEILTEEDGSFSVQLSAGNYTITTSAAGYVTQIKTAEMKSDGYKTFDFILMPV